jgi:hypothetical protein
MPIFILPDGVRVWFGPDAMLGWPRKAQKAWLAMITAYPRPKRTVLEVSHKPH